MANYIINYEKGRKRGKIYKRWADKKRIIIIIFFLGGSRNG